MALSKVDFNNINVTPAASKKLKWNSSANGFETGDVGGSMVLLSTQTASSSATISFTSDIDSTYKEYIFTFMDIHPGSNATYLVFQADTGTNTNYNIAATTSYFQAYETEAGGGGVLAYNTNHDDAQSTSFLRLAVVQCADNDASCVGVLHIFEPSSTTFVKHFFSVNQSMAEDGSGTKYSMSNQKAGYFNTTTALTRFRFKMSSGNIDAGTIKMYGVT